MLRRSPCRAASRKPPRPLARLPLLLATLALAGAAVPLAAATVLKKSVEIDLRADGSVAEHTRVEVRLDAAADLAVWSPYPIVVAEHHELAKLEAWVRRPDGTVEKLGRQAFDTVDVGGGETIQTSAKVRLVRFPEAPPGAVLGVDYQRIDHPYFPTGFLVFASHDAPIAQLEVRVRGGDAAWRWAISGPPAGLEIHEAPGEVRITAANLPAPARLEDAPDELRAGPVLRYGWREPATWAAVGAWYDRISGDLPRGRDEVRQASRRIVAAAGIARAGSSGDGDGPGDGGDGHAGGDESAARRRQALEDVLAFLRHEVRYVAVEVGVGGYRPAAPHETLARRWGDCKGKVALLLDLLAAAGIEAYPALVLAAPEDRIDPDFPSPFYFDHMIAVLPAAGLATTADDPVAGGYLFVDPTQSHGGAGWLHPADQDQWALMLRGERSALVRSPLRPELETERLTVDLAVRPAGGAAGQLRLELRGGAAAAGIERRAGERPEATDAEARRLIGALLPGAEVSAPRWLPDRDAGVPEAILTATVALPSLMASSAAPGPEPAGTAAGAPSGAARPIHWLALSGPRATPPPGLLRDRSAPVVLRPGIEEVAWHLALPAGWCPEQASSSGVDNAAGSFRQSLACAGDHLTVDRRTDLRQRWIDPAQLPALAELALAEHRAAARRLRLDRLGG